MMNKALFLSQLEKKMERIPQLEKERILNYYNETIEDAMEDGMDEKEVIASFGDMEDIVKQIYAEHELTEVEQPIPTATQRKPYVRYLLLIFTSPLWLTILAMMITLYVFYLCVIFMIFLTIVGVMIFFVMGCFHIFNIMRSNMASGIVLLGCELICLGIVPWCYWLLVKGIQYAKQWYQKGIDLGKHCWRKAVA